MSKAKVLYISRNDGTDVRVNKECRSLKQAGYELVFAGCKRWKQDNADSFLCDIESHIIEFPVTKFGLLCHTPRHASVLRSLLRRVKPHVVHCVNEDLAALALFLKGRADFKVVCDLFDSVRLRFESAGFLRKAVGNAVSRIAYERSNALIVTDELRKDHLGPYQAKTKIVWNYPDDPGEIYLEFPPERGPLRLCLTGTLMKSRGLSVVARLLDATTDIRVVSAGWIRDEVAQAFVDHPKVEYHGIVTNENALALAAGCHAIVAFYEPSNLNNILASPNKVYDALCVGRPIIINQETNISHWVSENQTGFLMPYDSLADLKAIIDEIRRQRSSLPAQAQTLRQRFRKGYSWDVAEKALLALYDDLTCRANQVASDYLPATK